MNNLAEYNPAEDVLKNHFRTMIVTDFTDRNGEKGQIVTLISKIGMFDETIMGINKSLKSGGKAISWQTRVFSLSNGVLKNTITYKPVTISIK
ncbi:MAG: hypothetical protein HDR98_11845 [Bacteroides sp.]|nr:hypothetical protein [Bacteroides sp.]